MTIKEVEEKTGLSRSNIRFYEKEKLIQPNRNTGNGYRDYSEKNVQDIRKIAYLRTLGISIDDIRKIMLKQVSLYNVIEKQEKSLKTQISDLKNASDICKKMLKSKELNYSDLKIEQYVPDIDRHWNENQSIFRLDSVSFLYIWGNTLTWSVIIILSAIIAVLSFPLLPLQIPIQWSGAFASSFVSKYFIFAYPAACTIIRLLVRPFIWRWLQLQAVYADFIVNYMTNYLCFLALSIQLFTILFVNEIFKNITAVLLLDTLILIGILLFGCKKLLNNKASV